MNKFAEDKEELMKKIRERTTYVSGQKTEAKMKFKTEQRKLEEENKKLQANAKAT